MLVWKIDRISRNLVLIETYWNVNEDGRNMKSSELHVLIETYWNVNTEAA